MNITEHFRLIWRRRWIILALSALIAVVVYVWSSSRANVYESTSTLDVLSGNTGTQPLTQEQVNILTARYAALADSSPVLDDAISSTGLNIPLATARQRVSADVPTSPTGFITVRATGPSPSSARSLTQGVVGALQRAGDQEQNPIQVVAGASSAGAPVSPTPLRDALLAFLIALVVNAELFALIGYLTGRFTRGRESEEVEQVTGLPVLALIPRQRQEWAAEAFRTLRAGVDLARSHPPVRTIAIVGAEPGSGASFVAFGLAQATANLRLGVVLVDANLRRPMLASELNVGEEPGLVEALGAGTVDWDALPQANPLQRGFRILPAGADVDDPPGVLGSGALRKILDQLDAADQVVVDSPAADESIDALVIASQCDAAVLVVDATRDRRNVIETAVSRLEQANVELLGTVVNRVGPDKRTEPPSRRRGRSPTPRG